MHVSLEGQQLVVFAFFGIIVTGTLLKHWEKNRKINSTNIVGNISFEN
jgi:hypothetical protein